jgi:hypothetical protein
VMLNEKPRRQFPDRRTRARRKTMHREQQLMLLWLDPGGFRRRLAEMKKLPDLAPELGEIAVLIESQISVHIYIVSRYKCRPRPGVEDVGPADFFCGPNTSL